jgi:hypothetical protein
MYLSISSLVMISTFMDHLATAQVGGGVTDRPSQMPSFDVMTVFHSFFGRSASVSNNSIRLPFEGNGLGPRTRKGYVIKSKI